MLVLAALCQVASSPGQTYLVSLFNPHFARELQLSPTELGVGYMLATLASAACQVVLGLASDRFGPRWLMGASASCLGFVCFGAVAVRGWFGLTLVFFGLRLLGQGALSLASGHTLTLYFQRHLGLAEGVRLSAMGVAMAVLPMPVTAVIERFGFRTAFAALGVLTWALVLPLWLRRWPPSRLSASPRAPRPPAKAAWPSRLRWRNAALPAAASARASLRQPLYWALLAVGTLQALTGTALLFHLHGLAHPASVGSAQLLLVLGGVGALSPLFAGRLVDRAAPSSLLPATCLLLGAATLLLSSGWPPCLFAGVLCLALSGALSSSVIGPTLARAFGPAHHATLRSALTTAAVSGAAVGPVLLARLSGTGGPGAGAPWLACAALALAPLVRYWARPTAAPALAAR